MNGTSQLDMTYCAPGGRFAAVNGSVANTLEVFRFGIPQIPERRMTKRFTVAPGLIFSEYDLDRVVTRARLDHGRIVLDLATTDLVTGGGTLGYLTRNSRNVLLNLVYTITQNAPLMLRSHGSLMLPGFTQGKLVDPEVDVYGLFPVLWTRV